MAFCYFLFPYLKIDTVGTIEDNAGILLGEMMPAESHSEEDLTIG